MSNFFKVFLVDDHVLVREGAAALIDAQPDMEVVGQGVDGQALIDIESSCDPDIVVVDVSMPHMNGMMVAKQVLEHCPNIRLLALSRYSDIGYVQQMMQAGVHGYVHKQSTSSELISAIRVIGNGGTYFDIAIVQQLLQRVTPAGQAHVPVQELSEQERRVAHLLALGHSNKEIATQMAIGVKTVETYKSRAMDKLGTFSRADLVRYALEHGWFDL